MTFMVVSLRIALASLMWLLIVACAGSSAQIAETPSTGDAACQTPGAPQPQFLSATYIPNGYSKTDENVRMDPCGLNIEYSVFYRADIYSDEMVWVHQDYIPGGQVPPAWTLRTTPAAIGMYQGHLATNDAGNKHSFIWSVGDMVLQVGGIGLPIEEIRLVAESVR